MLDWVSAYRREWLGSDVVAGLTTAAVVIFVKGSFLHSLQSIALRLPDVSMPTLVR